MKQDTHPQYYPEAKVTCVCGNTFTVGASRQELRVEACSACHPFYTGKERSMERVGQVQKFKQRVAKAAEKKVSGKEAKKKTKKKA